MLIVTPPADPDSDKSGWKVVGTVVIAALFFGLALMRSDDEPPDVAAPPDTGTNSPSIAAPVDVPVFVPEPATLAPGIHLLGALSPSVAYVIESDKGLILVDAGLEDGYEILRQQFRAFNLDLRSLTAILLTHGHGDHYLGTMRLRRETGAAVFAGAGDCDAIRIGGPREAVFSTFPMQGVSIPPAVVDHELRGGEQLEYGNVTIRAISTPGHTPGSMCYLLNRDGVTALFSGDTVMSITGDLGTYSSYLSPRYRGNAVDYLASLRKLQGLPVPDLLLPGHPQTNLKVVSARVTQQQWDAMLAAGVDSMQKLVRRFETDGMDFLDGQARELLDGLYYLGDFHGQAVYCLATKTGLICVNAPVSDDFAAFLTQRLSQINLAAKALTAVLVCGTDRESIGGISELCRATGCQVIATSEMHDPIVAVCPDANTVTPEEFFAGTEWPVFNSLSVTGAGQVRAVYEVAWQGKKVLLTGKIGRAHV